MIGLKNSFEIAYNGTENECRFELYADTAAEMVGVTHYDGIKIQMGSEFTDITTGDRYLLNGSGVWVLQPSANAFSNVYTKAEIDSMITEIYGIIAYYHTTIVSDTGEITFYSLGENVGTWAIYGNGQQTGTPTPDNPIQPVFVGVKSAQLLDATSYTTNENLSNVFLPYKVEEEIVTLTPPQGLCARAVWWNINNSVLNRSTWVMSGNSVAFSLNDYDGAAYFTFDVRNVRYSRMTDDEIAARMQIMVNAGSTALPYEPFGYKIPISCAGQTNNIYLSAPLRKAIDGTDAVDKLESTGTLTRNVDENGDALVTPTTETITVPAIPTVQGQNTLTVDTSLKPSKIEISGER